jgi:citrate lyase subunit beta/citryl-CoA lyase
MSHTQYAPARQRLQRSELAVPGSNPGMFEKAADSAADYVFLDLEDAVSPGDKVQARKNVIEALNDIDWRGRGKTVSVRIKASIRITCIATWSTWWSRPAPISTLS